MSNTSIHCAKCEGNGVLLINISSDGEGASYVEQQCPKCDGEGKVTRAALISSRADHTLTADGFMPIALTGAFRAVIGGDIFERRMTSRELYKLAHYALMAALETDKFEKRREEDGDNN
jgi:phage FluMu protein Com